MAFKEGDGQIEVIPLVSINLLSVAAEAQYIGGLLIGWVKLKDTKVKALFNTGTIINVITESLIYDAELIIRPVENISLVSYNRILIRFLGIYKGVDIIIRGLTII